MRYPTNNAAEGQGRVQLPFPLCISNVRVVPSSGLVGQADLARRLERLLLGLFSLKLGS